VPQKCLADSTILCTEKWPSYHGSYTAYTTVRHNAGQWLWDDDSHGGGEGHACTGEGAEKCAFRGSVNNRRTGMVRRMKPGSMPHG
jgi:hypothetical protein